MIIIICHVNDLIFTGPDDNIIEDIVFELTKSIKIEYISEVHQFLGMEIKLDYNN